MSASEGHRGLLRQGAIAGAAAWSTYAIVENIALVVLPRLLARSDAYRELHAGVSSLLFVLYPLLGALVGVGAGAVLSRFERARESRAALLRARLEAATMLPLVIAVGGTLLRQGDLALRVRLSGLAMSAACALVLTLAAGWGRRVPALLPLARPATVGVLLVGTPWVCDRVGIRPLGSALAGLAFVAVVVAVARFASLRSTAGAATAAVGPRYSRYLLPLVSLALIAIDATLHTTARLSTGESAAMRSAAQRPDIVLITLDTVRADHLSLYGYSRDTSPGLRELAARSTVYTRAIAPADMTLATHASIFSGLYPSRHGAHYDRDRCPAFCPLASGTDTLAELLSRSGYRTAAVVANYGFLGPFAQLDQGFQYYDSRRNVLPLDQVEPYTLRRTLQDLVAPRLSRELSERISRSAGEIVDQGIRQVDRLRTARPPFFLFLNLMDAHEPYMPPPPFDRLFPGRDAAFRSADHAALKRRVLRGESTVTRGQLAHLTSQYDGSIAYMDAELARFWRHLEATGRFDDALVIVTSDHGEAFGERQLMGHEVSVYEDQVHVPLLVKFPRQRQAATVEQFVSLSDLFPTILEQAGVRTPPAIDGRALLGAPPDPAREVLSETFGNHLLSRWNPRFRRTARAIFAGDLKLIVSTTGSREAYDLAADPAEARNLYRADPRWGELETHLDRWLRAAAQTLAGESHPLDSASEERLRSLGYL